MRHNGWGFAIGGVGLLAAAIVAHHVVAADQPQGPALSLLGRLSADTQRIYGAARRSVVRVQLPTRLWMEQFARQQQRAEQLAARFNPATRPATAPAVSRPAVDVAVQVPVLTAIGVLADRGGHVVLPIYFDRDVIGNSTLPAWTGDGRATTATFTGSDALTGLTLLQLAAAGGDPVSLDHGRPEDGTLAVVIAADGSGRLAVWSGLRQETGLVVLPDGSFAGFGFDAQHFFGADQAKPIVDQLIAHGEVRRPVMGLVLGEISADDMARQRLAALGSRAAVRVLQVEAGGAADAAGVHSDDVILTIGSRPVGDNRTFAAVVAGCDGDTVLNVLRGGSPLDVTVKLHSAPPAGR